MSHTDHSGHHASKASPEPFELSPLPPTVKPGVAAHSSHAAHAKPASPVHRALPAGAHPQGHFHPMPVIGHGEAFYVKHIQQAEAAGDRHAMASHKVGQHVTAALDPAMFSEDKFKRFVHCLRRYCVAPADVDESVQAFYQKLGEMVRRHAGQEALRLARARHGEFQKRLHAGESREDIADDAEKFFPGLLGHGGKPEWCGNEAWVQLSGLRDHWM